MTKAQHDADSTQGVDQELLAAFEHLPTAKKVDLFEEAMCLMTDALSRLDDPVLDRELDILDGIHSNIRGRLDEIKAIYGVE